MSEPLSDIVLSHDAEVQFDCIEAAAGDAERLPKIAMVAYTGDAIRQPPCPHPVVVDIAGMDISVQRRPIRFHHGEGGGIGHTEYIAVENGVLVARGVVSRDTFSAREAVASSKRGFPWQASIGATPLETELVDRGYTVNVNGRDFSGPVYVVRKSRLKEISLVDLGADDRTSATIAASLQGGALMSEVNTSVAPPNGAVQPGAPAPTPPQAQPPAGAPADVNASLRPSGSLEQIATRHRAENARRDGIHRLADRYMAATGRVDEIMAAAAHAVEAQMPLVEFENFCLNNYKPERAVTPSSNPIAASDNRMLECGLALALGVEDCDKKYNDQIAAAADHKWGRGLSLHELMLTAARANGENLTTVGKSEGQVKATLQACMNRAPGIRASSAFSTIDLPGILTGAVNRYLAQSFMSVEQSWRSISKRRPVPNYLGVTGYAMGGAGMAQDLGPGGELKHGTLSETTYTNRAKTRGEILAISMEDIVNDDLGALQQVTQVLARRQALKLNTVFWTEFLADNSTFYTTGRGNYASGGSTALDMASLKAASVLFNNQTDPDGNPLGVAPKFLVVPPALEFTALELMNSTSVNTGGSASTAQVPSTNVMRGRYTVVPSTYLSNATITGYSTTAWFLLADPNDVPVIETVFVFGRETPTIETAEADFNVLGIQMRSHFGYGVAKQEYRGGVKYAGA